MASDPGGGEGSWADDPGKAQSLECGLQHGVGGGADNLVMVAGESSDVSGVSGPSTRVTKKDLFKLEMQINRLRDEIKKEIDPKVKLMKCECLDDYTRELSLLKVKLEKDANPVPKVENWEMEKEREARAQTVKRREVIVMKDLDYNTVYSIVEQGTPVRCVGAAPGGSLLSGDSCKVTESPNTNNAEDNKGLSAADSVCNVAEGNDSPMSEPESLPCTDIVSETPLSTVSETQLSQEPSTQTEVHTVQKPQQCTESVNGVQAAEQSGAAPGASAAQLAEERPSTEPTAEQPQQRRLFSNVTRPASPPPQRKNAVRLRYTGPEQDLPSRIYIGKELLKDFMGFQASEIYALIHVPSSRIFDISFKMRYDLDLFWGVYNDTKNHKIWEHLQVISLSKPEVITATILFQSEVVAQADLELWLRRQCVVRSNPEKIYDEEEIWNGGYTVRITLLRHNGVTRHLPHSFYLGSERGICFYPGQPRLCHRCGGRHLAINCSRLKCSLCGQLGHVKEECNGVVVCNLCSQAGHTFRECPRAQHNKEASEEGQEEGEAAPGTSDTSAGASQSTGASDVPPESAAPQGSPATEETPRAKSKMPKNPAIETNVPSVEAALQVSAITGKTSNAKSKVSRIPATETDVPSVEAAPQVPAITETSPNFASKVSRDPVSKVPEQLPSTSTEAAALGARTSVDNEGFQTVKRKNTATHPSRKVTVAKETAEAPVLAITSGRYSALGEEEGTTPMEQVPSHLSDDPQVDEPDPSVSTKRWGTKSHSSGRKKKKKKEI